MKQAKLCQPAVLVGFTFGCFSCTHAVYKQCIVCKRLSTVSKLLAERMPGVFSTRLVFVEPPQEERQLQTCMDVE